MKVFLGSLKGKILLACVGTLVVTAVVVGAIFLFGGEETYRSIAVENLQGVTIITDEDLEKKEAFIPIYKKLLASTGKMNIADVCASVGIDVRDVNFWRSSLEMVKEDIDLFIKLLNK